MNRRSFFGRLGKCVAAIAIAGHLKLGELVPVPQILTETISAPVHDYYVIQWPVISRTWRFGTYVNDILDQYINTR